MLQWETSIHNQTCFNDHYLKASLVVETVSNLSVQFIEVVLIKKCLVMSY